MGRKIPDPLARGSPLPCHRLVGALLMCGWLSAAAAWGHEAFAGTAGAAGVAGCPSDAAAAIRRMLAQGSHERAAEMARRCLDALAVRHKGTLEALRLQDLLVESRWRGRGLMDPETLRLAEQTLEARQQLVGPDGPELVASLNNLGDIFRLRGESERSRDAYERALALGESAWGGTDLRLARTLRGLADTVAELGEPARCRELAERSLKITSLHETPPGPETLRSSVMVGISLYRAGRYEDSRARLEEAIAGLEKAFGRYHPELGEALVKLGNAEGLLGHFEAAQAAFTRGIELIEKGYAPKDSRLQLALANSSTLYWRKGEFLRARDLDERVLRMMDDTGNLKSWRRVGVLTNLGMNYRGLGDWPNAAANYEKALEMGTQVMEPYNPSLGNILNSLGNLYSDMGEIAKARDYQEKALAIWEKAYPPEHPLILTAQSNLSRQLQLLGEYDQAQALLLRALASQEKVFGTYHHEVAESLENLGELYESMHDLPHARESFQRALQVREKIYGPRHRSVAKSFNNLARIEMAAGRPREALDLALRAEAIARDEFEATAKVVSENEALSYEQIRTSGLDLALSVLALSDRGSNPGPEVERVWEELIRSRAQVLDEMAARHRSVLGEESPALRTLAEELTAARRRYSHLLAAGPDAKSPESYPAALAAAQQDLQASEKELAARSAAFRESIARPASWIQSLRSALPRDGALLAYVSFRFMKPLDPTTPRGPAPAPRLYGALLLKPREKGALFLRLASSEEIDRKVLAWRSSIDSFRERSPLVRGGSESVSLDEGAELRRAIWDPVADRLRGVRRLFVVPEGSLNLVNFYALPVKPDSYLVETAPLIHYASAERDLVLPGKVAPTGKRLLAFGGPDFDALPGAPVAAAPERSAGTEIAASTPRFRSSPPTCAEFLKLKFGPLPMSVPEVSEIGTELSGTPPKGVEKDRSLILTGRDASEDSFKRLASTRPILHVATHGFFLGDCEEKLPGASTGEPSAAARPLLLSGMALAGANRRSEAGADDEDGILTAEEIASLDLSGVDWAVLSACETGLGRIQAGEGVLGLRRAFQVAGVRTLIMSLWKVEDDSTRSWMRRLYQARLAGRSTAEAVRSAGLAILHERQARGLSTHPFYWGAFVAAGDWR